MADPKSKIYQIRLQGILKKSWTGWFDGMTFTHESDGTTTLTGEIVDQAALHGLLKKIRDLGLPLISVNQVDPDQTEPMDIEKYLRIRGIVAMSKQNFQYQKRRVL